MNVTKSSKRTMIILWKWKDLELINHQTGYDEVKIAKSEEDKIIRINKPEVKTVIDLIVDFTFKEIGDVFIFLHRNHGFNESHVNIILERLQSLMNSKKIKCFLFSDSRDFIYYSVQKEGLLDETGLFAEYDLILKNENGEEYETEVSVLEYDEKGELLGVKYQHFNRTWKYYENEFYEKIKCLGIDLMTRITFNDKINQASSVSLWHEYLAQFNNKQDKFIWYRLKSLLGFHIIADDMDAADKKIIEKELALLSHYERSQEMSFSFDDVRVNLEEHHVDGVDTAYKKLCDTLNPVVTNTSNTIINIKEIRDVFGNLLKRLE
jgi:hypothetical protein